MRNITIDNTRNNTCNDETYYNGYYLRPNNKDDFGKKRKHKASFNSKITDRLDLSTTYVSFHSKKGMKE